MVWQPLNEIGKYGGTWRRAFTGPGDVRERQPHQRRPTSCFFWSADGSKIVPCVAKAYELSDDGKTYTHAPAQGHEMVRWRAVHRRRFHVLVRGHLRQQGDRPDADPRHAPRGKPGRMVKVDEITVRLEFDVPYFLFEEIMAGDTDDRWRTVGAPGAEGQLRRLFARALSQAVPAEIFIGRCGERQGQAEGFENWVQMLHFKKDWSLNTELPTLGPWRTVQPINNPIWLLERNPFYYAVDTAGNQLPYFDRVQFTLAREPGGHQPARDGRRIRRAGAPHRSGQAAGAAG